MEFPPHHALFRLKPIPIEGYPLHDRASSPLFQGRFAGVLLMKSLRSDDEKSGSSERRCCLSPLPTHSWASLITPPVGLARGPSVRSTDRPEDRPPNSDVVAESFPLLGRTWPFLYPSAPSALPPSLRFRPSVRPSQSRMDLGQHRHLDRGTDGRNGWKTRRRRRRRMGPFRQRADGDGRTRRDVANN